MNTTDHMSISRFARLSGISRPNLIFYDKIGLLQPAKRGNNGNRYYSQYQLGTTYMILILREIGLSLAEIGTFSKHRTPERMSALFSLQKKKARQGIQKLQDAIDVMQVYVQMAEEVEDIRADKITIQRCAADPIFPGPAIDYSTGKTYAQAIIDFWHYCQAAHIPLNYPLGARISKKQLMAGEWHKPEQLYLRTRHSSKRKTAGLYAVGYARGNYGQTDGLYKRLVRYIRKCGYVIAGEAYEEYPLNEVSIQNPQDFLIRIAIRVKSAKPRP